MCKRPNNILIFIFILLAVAGGGFIFSSPAASQTDSFSITVTVTGISNPVISSEADQLFVKGDPSTSASNLTITDSLSSPQISAANDIRVKIPDDLNLGWDTSVSAISVAGAAAAKVSSAVSYPDEKTLLVDVTTDFSVGDQITLSGMKYANFTGSSLISNLGLIVGGPSGSIAATDNKTLAIAAPTISSYADQTLYQDYPYIQMSTITITDDTYYPVIIPGKDIRIRIPATLDATWDPSKTTPVYGGGAAGRGGAVSYEDGNKTLVVTVVSSFGAGDALSVSNLGFTNITSTFEGRLELEVNDHDTSCALDDKNFISLSSVDMQGVVLKDQDTHSATYTNSREVDVELTVTALFSLEAMQISEDPSFAGVPFTSYNNPSNYVLSSADGAKTVYAKVRTTYGTVSDTRSGTITLDTTPPQVSDIAARGRVLVSGDAIAENASFTARVSDAIGLDPTTIYFALNGIPVEDGTASNRHYDSYDSGSGAVSYSIKTDLLEGEYSLKVGCYDLAANLGQLEITGLRVYGGAVGVIGTPLIYPNPANPDTGPIYFSYNLTKDAKIDVYLFDITMAPVWHATYFAGAEGGKAGYNEVAWDGITSFAAKIEPGAYVYRIVAEIDGKKSVIGKGKLGIVR